MEKKAEMSGEPWKGVRSGGKWESDGCEQWKKWEWWRMVGRVERWEIAGMGEQWKEWRMVERVGVQVDGGLGMEWRMDREGEIRERRWRKVKGVGNGGEGWK